MADTTAVIRAREARKVILGAVSPTTVTTSNTGPSEFTVSDDRTGRFVRVNTGKRNVIVLKVVKADLPTSASLQLPVFREYGKAAGPGSKSTAATSYDFSFGVMLVFDLFEVKDFGGFPGWIK